MFSFKCPDKYETPALSCCWNFASSIPASSIGRVVGGLEPIPAVIGREAGYTLDRSPVHHRATQRQTTTDTLTLTPLDNFRDTYYPNMHVFGVWEEAGV